MNRRWLRIGLAVVVMSGLAVARGWADEQQAARPNVLLIAVDDLNDWVGFLNGHPQTRTPNMDRLAKRGMVFTNAHCAAPLCCPSRAALFSGRQPYHTGIYSNEANIRQFHPEYVLLQQYFAQQGYRVLGTGKLLHHDTAEVYDEFYGPEQRWSPLSGNAEAMYTKEELKKKATDLRHVVRVGQDQKEVVIPLNRMPSDRNPDGPRGESFDWGPWDVGDEEMGDGQITTWAVEQLARPADKPLLLCVGFYRPHIPLWAPRTYFEPFPEKSIQLPKVLNTDLDDLSPLGKKWAIEADTAGLHATVVKHHQWRAAVAAYLACVSFVDAQVGRLLDALDQSEMRGNTIVVLWSDHGWHLGEKEHWGKWTGWERATRVPLVIAPAKNTEGKFARPGTCDRPVSLIDLYPTLVDLCGLPAKDHLDGKSLVPLLKDPARQMPPVISTFDRGNYTVRDDRWRLIHYADGSEEFYDHQADPDEWHNLADQPAHEQDRERLRKLLPKKSAEKLGE